MMTIAGSGGVGTLTFFNSQLGVAIATGVLFFIVCLLALFVVISIKKIKNPQLQSQNFQKQISKPVSASHFGNLSFQLTDADIGKMAWGSYLPKKKIFQYHGGGKIFHKFQSYIRNKNYIRVELPFLPKVAKKIDIFFSLAPNIKDKCNFYIKSGNQDIKVNQFSQVVEGVEIQEQGDNYFIEFRIEYTEEFDEKLWQPSGLEILVKSFSI